MLDTFLEKLLGIKWFRRSLALVVILYTFKLTNWGATFAMATLAKGGDLVGAAGIIAAVSAIPLGLLTMLFKWYDEKRTSDDASN